MTMQGAVIINEADHYPVANDGASG